MDFASLFREHMFVAEIGINHDGMASKAIMLIDAAYQAGVRLFKLQLQNPDQSVPPQQKNVVKDTIFGKMPYIEYKRRMRFSPGDILRVMDHVDSYGDAFLFTSVFDTSSFYRARSLDLGQGLIKIPSPKLTTDEPLDTIQNDSWTKQIILSTGMSSWDEIQAVVDISCDEVPWLMHCVSSYPHSPKDANLACIEDLKGLAPRGLMGYSCHSAARHTKYLAIAAGYDFVEAHITFSRKDKGTDHAASTEIEDIPYILRKMRLVKEIMGSKEKKVFECEWPARVKLRGR